MKLGSIADMFNSELGDVIKTVIGTILFIPFVASVDMDWQQPF